MQLDEQVTEGTKHGSIRVDMHGAYGVMMALFKKKSGKKIKLEKIVIVMFF